MEWEALQETAAAVKRLKMFPYFDIAHYVLMCLAVKEDSYPTQFTGSKQTFSDYFTLL